MHRCLSLSLVFLLPLLASAQQVIPHAQDKPPGPALSPQEAIAKMQVPPGFAVELVASEPDLVNPVAFTFDEKGRIWVAESLEYPRKQPGKGRDRIKVLKDTDGDGKADKFTIFADGLNIPSGIAVGHGGVWVANSPDILFYPDVNRDAVPDGEPQVVVTGFGRHDTHELPNSFTWGPDGWLYALNGVFNHSHVKYVEGNPNFKADHPGWQLTCALFRIHPVTREFQVFCEGTSNPWGVAIDGEGSFFVSACVIDHLWHLVETGYYHRQGGPYPPFTWKIDSIVKHKHQKAAYCGIHWFDSDAYPEEYRQKLYMGNIHGNCINSDELTRDGSTYFGKPREDFLTANDAWFMPVGQETGPDGCLYILDWYDRYHCYQDANRDPAGIDRLKGRLYRVRYKNTPRAAGFDLSKETDVQLIEQLNAGSDFVRHTAQRLLTERASQQLQAVLEETALDESLPRRQRLHAMWALIGSGYQDLSFHLSLLRDKDPIFRAWGARAIGDTRVVNAGALDDLRSLAKDESPDVRLQAAIAAPKLSDFDPLPVLVDVLAHAGDDKLIPHIVWQNLHPMLETQPDAFLAELERIDFEKSPAVAAILPRAAERILARKQFEAAPIAALFTTLRDRSPAVTRQCLELIAARVQSGEIRGQQLEELKKAFSEPLAPLLASPNTHPVGFDAAILAASWNDARGRVVAQRTFATRGLDPALRLRALSALVAAGDDTVLTSVEGILAGDGISDEFAGQIIATLGKSIDPEVATVVLAAWQKLSPQTQPKAIELLTQRKDWAKALLEAMGAKKVPAEALNANQAQKLLAQDDKELTAAVAKYWGTVRTSRDPQREAFVAEMRKLIRSTPGDAHRGIEVFNKVCGQCHKMHGQGQEVGPDITLNGRGSFEQLLSNVFDPSLVIGVVYQGRTVRTSDGRVITGLPVEDSPQRVVLKVQGGKLETIAREDIEAMKTSELSLMPEGLEKQLKPQEIADLFAYITLDKHPDDPSAKLIPGTREGR